jgi:hypothetical protein
LAAGIAAVQYKNCYDLDKICFEPGQNRLDLAEFNDFLTTQGQPAVYG